MPRYPPLFIPMHVTQMTLHTLPESLGLLRNKPVARIHVDQLKQREELADQRDQLVRHVLALGAPHKKRGLQEPNLAGVLEGEIAQVVERLCERGQGDAELLRALWRPTGPVQVSQEELPDRERLLVRLEDLVGLGLPGHVGLVDLLHALDVAREVALQAGVDGRVVDRDYVGDEVGAGEGEGHCGFCAPFFCVLGLCKLSVGWLAGWGWMDAKRGRGRGGGFDLHGVADQGRLLQAVLGDEVGDVGGHGGVVVAMVVRGLAVVAEVLISRICEKHLDRTKPVWGEFRRNENSPQHKHGVLGLGQVL